MRRQAAALAQRTCGCFPLDLSAIDTHSAITTVVSVASNIPHCVRSVEWRDLHFGNGDGAIETISNSAANTPDPNSQLSTTPSLPLNATNLDQAGTSSDLLASRSISGEGSASGSATASRNGSSAAANANGGPRASANVSK